MAQSEQKYMLDDNNSVSQDVRMDQMRATMDMWFHNLRYKQKQYMSKIMFVLILLWLTMIAAIMLICFDMGII